MGCERVDLAHEFGLTRIRRWRSGTLNGHTEVYATLGQLADGRWFADHTRKHGGAYVHPDERSARELVGKWLAVGEWKPIPACFDSNGQPADGRQWKGHGQMWLPDDGQ